MKRLGIRVLTAAIASSMVVLSVSATEPSIDEMKRDKQAAQGEVNSLQKQLTEIVTKISDLEDDLTKTGEQIEQATVDLEEATTLEQQQYADMKLRIKYMYEEGNESVVEALLSCNNFSELVNKAEYVQNVHEYDRDKLQEYVETKEKVSTLKTTLENDQKEMEALEADFQSQEKDLNTMIGDKQEEVSDLETMIQDAVEEAARKAAEEEAARQAAEEEAARQAEEAGQAAEEGSSTVSKDSGSDEDSDSSSSSSSSSGSSSSSSSSSSDSGSSSASSSYVAGDAVSRAYSALGKPYSWGAVGPDAYDCSGLVSFCLTGRHARVYTSSSLAGCTKVTNPQPGDVCVKPGHVGIYIGGGQMIHAPQTGDVVKIAPVQSGMWYVRP